MKTFKRYLEEQNDSDKPTEPFLSGDNFLRAFIEKTSTSPFNFRWHNYDRLEADTFINEVVAARVISCDNIDIQVGGFIIHATINDSEPALYIDAPSIMNFCARFIEHPNMNLDRPPLPLFRVVDFVYTEPKDLDEPYTRMCFNTYNLYTSLKETIPIKTIKTLEYVIKSYPDIAVTIKGLEDAVSIAKVKYFPQEQLTDDEYAIHAAHNL
jgi:hypothetical protein